MNSISSQSSSLSVSLGLSSPILNCLVIHSLGQFSLSCSSNPVRLLYFSCICCFSFCAGLSNSSLRILLSGPVASKVLLIYLTSDLHSFSKSLASYRASFSYCYCCAKQSITRCCYFSCSRPSSRCLNVINEPSSEPEGPAQFSQPMDCSSLSSADIESWLAFCICEL